VEIVSLSAIARRDWEAFVDTCDECWLYHHPVFLDLDDTHSRSFAVLHNGKVAGGCALYVNRSGFGKMLGGRYGPAGLALQPAATRRAYPLVREYLFETARKSGCHAIQMALPMLAPAYQSADYLDTHLYHLGFNNALRWGTLTHYTPSYTTIIDLALPLDEIWGKFSELVRRKCRDAAKTPFDCEFLQQTSDDAHWAAFLRNHEATMRRGGASALPESLLDRLRKLLAGGHAALINCKVDAEIVASLLLLTYKNSAFYFASGVQLAAYSAGFAAQLHWTAIQELQRRGFEKYEVGQFYPALRGVKLKSLGEFKRMFGGTKRPVLSGELVTQELRFLALDVLPAYGRKWAKSLYAALRRK
jgi:GNAT acetyltransferase-like protein